MTCLTCGLNETLSLPASAARAGFAPGPLGTSSWERASAVVGFCGMVGCTPSMASQCAGGNKISHQTCSTTHCSQGRWWIPTCEGRVSGHFGQRRIDEFLKVHLLVFDVEQRLSRSQARLAIPKRSRRLVPVERLNIKHLHGLRHILDRESSAAGGSHEAQTLDNDLTESVFDILREALEGFLVERADANRLGDILDVLGVPEQLGLIGRLGWGRSHCRREVQLRGRQFESVSPASVFGRIGP